MLCYGTIEKVIRERAKELSFNCPREIKLSGTFFFWSPITRFEVSLKRINEDGACVTEMECSGFGVEINKPRCF